jgi:hypothetical protein
VSPKLRSLVLFAAATLWTAQGTACAQGDETPPIEGTLSEEEFRRTARSVSSEVIDPVLLGTVLSRASVRQGTNLVRAASLPRNARQPAVVGLFARIWEGKAADIPISVHPVFRLSVASALYRLQPEQCSGCSDYARALLLADDLEIRRAAALAMATLGLPEDIPALQRLIILDDISVAENASTALTYIQESNSVEILQRLKDDPAVSAAKREVILQAIESLEGRRRIVERRRAE